MRLPGRMQGLGTGFWRLFASSATSNLADGVGRTALPLLAASLTRDPLLISGLATFAFLPWLLFALISGAVVDRVDRRHAMAAANAARAAVLALLALAVVIGQAHVVLLYVAAFLVGAAETVYDSAARAMLPAVVRRDQIDRGNSLLVTEEMVGQSFLGAPVGALLFTVAAALPLLGNTVGFLVAALLILGLRGNFRPPRESRTTVRADIGSGLRWLRADRLLYGLMLVSGVVVAAGALADGLIVLLVLQDLAVPEAGFGVFVLAGGVGGILGGLVAPRIIAHLGRMWSLAAATSAAGLCYLTLALVDRAVVGAVLFAGYGLAVIVWNVASMSLRQALVPTELFGRVYGAWRTLVWGVIPLATVGGGLLASVTSVRTVFMVSGAVQILCAALVVTVLRPHRERLRAAFMQDPAPDTEQVVLGDPNSG